MYNSYNYHMFLRFLTILSHSRGVFGRSRPLQGGSESRQCDDRVHQSVFSGVLSKGQKFKFLDHLLFFKFSRCKNRHL